MGFGFLSDRSGISLQDRDTWQFDRVLLHLHSDPLDRCKSSIDDNGCLRIQSTAGQNFSANASDADFFCHFRGAARSSCFARGAPF